MAGKRQKKQNRKRLPGILMLLVALAAVVSPTGPAGIAADSPLQDPSPAEAVTAMAAVEVVPTEPEFILRDPEPTTGMVPLQTLEEVDAVVDRLANIIANSINIAIHPGVTMEDINKYTF